MSNARTTDTREAVSSQLELLSEFHTLAHEQTDRSFTVARCFGVTGVWVITISTIGHVRSIGFLLFRPLGEMSRLSGKVTESGERL